MAFLKKILFVIGLLLIPTAIYAATAVPWQLTNPTDVVIVPSKVNGIIKGIIATSTTQVYINSNRIDSYTADGTQLFPYKTITAANTAVVAAGLASAGYWIAPGTYAEQGQSFPNIPLVIQSNGATILALSGASVGAGTFTFPSDVTWYDAVVFGNVSYTSASLTNPHTMVNPFIAGNVTFSGLGFMVNGAVVDQNKGLFPFLTASTTGSLVGAAGSLVNVVGSQIQVVVRDLGGFMNLDDVGVFTSTSTVYAIDASTAGSQLAVNGMTLFNYSTGGGINCNNGAPASLPNEMTSFSAVVGVGTPANNAVSCGSAISYVNVYTASDLVGKRYYASGSGLNSLENAALNVEGNSYQNVLPGFKSGFGTSTPFADLSIHANNGDTALTLFAIGSSTATATSTLFSISNTGSITTNLATGCVTNTSGVISSTGSACGSGSGSGVGTVATSSLETSGQIPYWTTTSGYPAKLGTIATGTITCAGTASCTTTGLSIIGGNLTITGTGGSASGLATSSPVSPGNVLVYTGAGAGSAYGIATGTVSAGSSAITVTAGRAVIGGALAIDCAGASASQNGCLASADWTTFNNKQATISVTTPIQLSGATLAWSGLATTSQPSSSNLLVSNGSAGVFGVATSSETCSTGISCASHSIIGTSGAITLATINAGVLGAQLNSTVPTSQATSTLYGNSTGGMVLGWSNTLGGLGFIATSSSFANLTATDGTLTFSGTYNGSTARTIGLNLGQANTWTALQQFNGNASTTQLTVSSTAYFASTTVDTSRGIGISIGTTTWHGAQSGGYLASTTGSAAYTIDWNKGNVQRLLLNQNATVDFNATSSHPIDGGFYGLKVCQDSTGSRTFTFADAVVLRWGSQGTTTISSTANTCTYIGAQYDALSSIYSMLGSTTAILNQ